jgi:hypothetical protein
MLARRLLLAVVAVLVCIAVTGPFRGLASVRASIALTRESMTVSRVVTDTDGSQRRADVERKPGVDFEAIENELDDEDDDALNDVAHESSFALGCAPRRRHSRPPRIEITSDTSRWSSRASLARGPPV